MIKEVIVVEGRDDITAVKAAVEAEVIAVGGFGINKKVIDKIKEAQARKGVIVLTDPDFAGEKIRSIIAKRVPNVKHAYIDRAEGTKNGDIGVENACPECIREALDKAKCHIEEKREVFDSQLLFYYGLMAGPKAKKRREALGKALRIGYANSAQLISRLNSFNISEEEFINAVKVLDEEIGR